MDRRRFLALTGAGLGGLAGCTDSQEPGTEAPTDTTPGGSPSPTDPPPLEGSWASYQHDAANTGATDDPGPTAEPVERWRLATTTGRPATAPAVADGVFVVATETGVLYARDVDDGSVRWSRSLPATPAVAPVATAGTVVVAAEGTLFGLAADTGAERWTASVDEPIRGLVTTDGRVVVATEAAVEAYALADGTSQWSRATDTAVATAPGVGDGQVAVGLASGLLALDAESGQPRWRSSVGGEPTFAPAVYGETVYVPVDSRLVALDADTGNQRWAYDANATLATSPVATDTAVYVDSLAVDAEPLPPTPDTGDETPTPQPTDVLYFGSELVSLSPPDGSVQWRARLTAEYNFTSGPPTRLPLVLADGRLVVGLDGALRAFDAATGAERWSAKGVGVHPVATEGVVSTGTVGVDLEDGSVRWRFQSSDSVSPPSVVDNTVYAGSDDTYLYALAANAGTVEWATQTDGPVRAAPTVGEDAVYVGTLDGTLYAFDRDDGSERWRFDVGGQVQPPALYDGTVYVGNFSPTITAVDAASGTERWRTRAERDETSGQQFIALELAVADGTVYTGANGDIRAFDAASGEERWRVTHGSEAVVQSPLAVGDKSVFVNVGNSLRALDPADGTERWANRTGSTNRPPVVREGTVYSSGGDAVYAFDATDGTRRWKQRVGGEFALAAGDGAVYGLGFDTPLVALDPEDGSELWRHGDKRLLTPPAVADDFLFVGDDAGRVHGFGPASR